MLGVSKWHSSEIVVLFHKQFTSSSEDKKKILEMLTRLDAEEESMCDSDDEVEDDNEADSLEKRLAGLDLGMEWPLIMCGALGR